MSKTLTVADLLREAGGAIAISKATQSTKFKVGVNAVHKWAGSGVPRDHIPLMRDLTGRTADEIVDARRGCAKRPGRPSASDLAMCG